MNLAQKEALRDLDATIRAVQDTGVFDALCAYVHPDVINGFVDAVAEALEHEGAP